MYQKMSVAGSRWQAAGIELKFPFVYQTYLFMFPLKTQIKQTHTQKVLKFGTYYISATLNFRCYFCFKNNSAFTFKGAWKIYIKGMTQKTYPSVCSCK